MLCSKEIFATAQYGDILIVSGDTVWIHSNPLEGYFSKKGNRIIGGIDLNDTRRTNSALWRGYVATWKLENDSLFLVRVQAEYGFEDPIEIDLRKEFGYQKVFAQWVNDTIVYPMGKTLKRTQMAYTSVYEAERYYTIKAGKLIDTKQINFVEVKRKLLFPDEDFLADTVYQLVLKSIDKAERDRITENESCFLRVSFNKKQKISYIGLDEGKPNTVIEEIVVKNAKNALKGFPKLMKVNHSWYYPPTFDLYFNAHCLKFPHDREYGCKFE
jgi:hypothetical protein